MQAWTATPRGGRRALRLLLLLLVLLRVVYHVVYVIDDPFALVTFSDGQLYEEAARDIVAHPPLGTQPFYLQGLYAYLLALGMSLHTAVINGLVLQLLLAFAALYAFARAARRALGPWLGSLSALCLLACPSVAFYENKYLSVALGLACNIFVLWAFSLCTTKLSKARAVTLGVASGLSVLGRANLILALPATAYALWLCARAQPSAPRRQLIYFALGVSLALAPMAARNWLVTGYADILPSHGGGIPFYIGNNPSATGRWNTAGGLLSGQVAQERTELAEQLAIHGQGRALDEALGRALYARGLAFIASHPVQWLGLEAQKLWFTLGNHALVRDYDLFGEHELIGLPLPLGVAFGVVLGLGALGLWSLYAGSAGQAPEALTRRAILWALCGQLGAVLAANLLWFTSAQNRVPLLVPLAFAAGPGLAALGKRIDGAVHSGWPAAPSGIALAVCALLTAQAFWPRLGTYRASSVHYYNLASVEETLGRSEAALGHYQLAAERSPKQPMFWLSEAHLARELGHREQAARALRALRALPGLPPRLQRAAADEQRALDTQ